MSMDFIYDLKDRLDEQGMEYIIMTIKDRKKELIIDTFYAVTTESSKTAFCASMDNLCEKWENGEIIKTGEEVNLTPEIEEDFKNYDEDEEDEDEDK